MTKLIINADDFGYSKVFNEKILDLLEKEFIKSTTVLVNWITDEQKDQIHRLKKLNTQKNISAGLHVESKSKTESILDQKEIARQYELFKKLFGFEPSHLDVHKFIESSGEATKFANEHNLPIRNHGQKNIKTKNTPQPFLYFKEKYCEFNWPEMNKFLTQMQVGGTYELCVHPGEYDPNSTTTINESREKDYQGVIELQPVLKEKNIINISYNDL